MEPIALIRNVLAGAAVMAAVAALPVPATAALPDEAYFAARDAAIARFKALDDEHRLDDAAMKAHDEALADLATRARWSNSDN